MEQQVHCSRRRLLQRGLEFHVCAINKSAHTKKVWKLIVCSSYIYIYMCVCVCACVYVVVIIYIYMYECMYVCVLNIWGESSWHSGKCPRQWQNDIIVGFVKLRKAISSDSQEKLIALAKTEKLYYRLRNRSYLWWLEASHCAQVGYAIV